MGLFDKLKVAAGGTPNVKSSEPKEDLSGASLIDLIEKIDTYNTQFCDNLNSSNYIKLETAMLELANRIPTIPLAKRGIYSQYTMYYKQYLDTYKKCIALGPKGKEIARIQGNAINQFCSAIAVSLSE